MFHSYWSMPFKTAFFRSEGVGIARREALRPWWKAGKLARKFLQAQLIPAFFDQIKLVYFEVVEDLLLTAGPSDLDGLH